MVLNKRIIFQTPPSGKNQYGEIVSEWAVFKAAWANISPVSGRDFFKAETVNSEVTHKVLVRHILGLQPSMRIKYGNRFFSIISILNLQERNMLLQIMCRELI